MKSRTIVVVGGAVAVVAAAGVAGYERWWRTPCLTWGARPEEVARTMPGDDLLADPDLIATRAISIDAPPAAVWPWLTQMGPGRGGVYTYDWIENLFGLGVHSVDVILPEEEHLTVGDVHRLGSAGPSLRVEILDRERAMVLAAEDGTWVWAFGLYPQDDGGTRLVSRNRIATPGAGPLGRFVNEYVMEPGSLIMERKMLLGIKERAEGLGSGVEDLEHGQLDGGEAAGVRGVPPQDADGLG